MTATELKAPAPRRRRTWATAKALTVELPWIWVFLAVVAMWAGIVAVSGRGLLGTMTAAIALAPFLVIVGIGQMFVITSGNGNIDLSVQYTMPLAGFVGISVMSGGGGRAALGALAAVGVGLAIAAANLFCILVLAIPPIVATLSVGLMAYSASSIQAQSFSALPDAGLHAFTVSSVGGVSWLAIACVGLALVAGAALHRMTYGRALQAVGQNRTAASLAGLPVTRVIIISYVVCGVLAAVSGLLLATYVSPSSLDRPTVPVELDRRGRARWLVGFWRPLQRRGGLGRGTVLAPAHDPFERHGHRRRDPGHRQGRLHHSCAALVGTDEGS